MDITQSMSITKIEEILLNILDYINTKDINSIISVQNEIKQLKDLDYSIATYNDLETNTFVEDSHGPGRIVMMLLNSFGEHACDNRRVTINGDDPGNFATKHNNTYRLHIKDAPTHDYIYPGNPTKDDEPYDYTTEFISQITEYPDNKIVDTTNTAWDSFVKQYAKPSRKLDFKSAFWKSNKHLHNANYSISIGFDGNITIKDAFGNRKTGKIEKMSVENKIFYDKYMNWLQNIEILNKYSWNDFITDDDIWNII